MLGCFTFIRRILSFVFNEMDKVIPILFTRIVITHGLVLFCEFCGCSLLLSAFVLFSISVQALFIFRLSKKTQKKKKRKI